MATTATLLLAVPAANAASAPTPLKIDRFTGTPNGTFSAGERLNVEARIRNTGPSTLRHGRFEIYLTRKATTSPSGHALAQRTLPSIRAGRSAISIVGDRLEGREGRYRIVACLRSSDRKRRCIVLSGALTVAPIRN